MAIGDIYGIGAGGVFAPIEYGIHRKTARKARKTAAAREQLAKFQLPFITQRAEESIYRRGIEDSSIAPTVRQEAALRADALRKQIAESRQRRKAGKRLQRLGIAKQLSEILGTTLGLAFPGKISEGAIAGGIGAKRVSQAVEGITPTSISDMW